MYKGSSIPLVYALLKNKQTNTYKQLFGKLFEILGIPNFGDSILMGDFEICNSAFFSFCKNIKYCQFHLAQNIVKKARSISTEYDSNYDKLKKRLISLCFLPLSRIDSAFSELQNIHTSENEKKLLSYFHENYISGKYKKENWCCYLDATRTNNSTESFHRQLNRFIKCSKPSFHKFTSRLFKFMDNRRLFIQRLKKNQLPRPNAKSVERNYSLMNIMLKEKQFTNIDFLDCASETSKKQVKEIEKDVSFVVDDDAELSVHEDDEFELGDLTMFDEMSEESSTSSSTSSETSSESDSNSSNETDSEEESENSNEEVTDEQQRVMNLEYNSNDQNDFIDSSESVLEDYSIIEKKKKVNESKPKKAF